MSKYEEIVKAAAKIFKAKGYHAATVQDIASEVGMLKGSLYYHIQGKEQLLTEVLLSAAEVLCEGLSRMMTFDLTPEEKLRQAVLFHISAYLDREELPVFYNELGNLSAGARMKIKAAIKDYEDIWLSILRDGAVVGVFRQDLPPRIVLQAVFDMCNGTHKWFRPGGRLSPAEIGEVFVKIILDGVRK
ncbi:MAG TPA: TetR/AcrR family transcriptional regulator [Spirochaetia bacterium]|nr:TetR/AcrR family transcriptional regulator [Spirochaetia bacterium]